MTPRQTNGGPHVRRDISRQRDRARRRRRARVGALVIDVTDGVTSIEVSPDGILFMTQGSAGILPQERSLHHRHATGARVTVEFSRPAPVPPNSPLRVYYDIAENGGLREIVGIPQLTHTTACQVSSGRLYHYRLSYWIAAPSVMRFIPPRYAVGLAARGIG